MGADMRIVELMNVPPAGHDRNWLIDSLHAAIKLEFATLPPYLTAWWSIKDSGHDVANSIYTVVLEEMLHLGIACNLLVGLGGTPRLNTPDGVPRYPGPLPGGVLPDLCIPLRGLSKRALKLFMQIEYPEDGPVAMDAGVFMSIGAFYNAIESAFENLQPRLCADGQVDGWLGLAKIRSLPEVKDAIQLIKRQGEGSRLSPVDTGPKDLAHYYRFAQVYKGNELKEDPVTHRWDFNGPEIRMPDAWPVAEVPWGGYQQDEVTPEVWQLVLGFDQTFTTLMGELQAAWTGNPGALAGAVTITMPDLTAAALELVKIPIPGDSGNYGPCFRLVSAQ